MGRVLFEGDEAVTLLAKMPHNGSNANAPAGMQVSPSQQKLFITTMGSFPATTTAGGMGFAFPDVCKVPAPPAPPIPVPFPSITMIQQSNGGTCPKKVKVENKPPCTLATKCNRTSGDEAGVAGGVTSGCNMGPSKYSK